MGRYSLSKNTEYCEAQKTFDSIIAKERELEKKFSEMNLGGLERTYRELLVKEFSGLVKTFDLENARENLKAARQIYDDLCSDAEVIPMVKPSAIARMETARNQAEHEIYLSAKKDFKPIFVKIIENLRALSVAHQQIRNIIDEIAAASVSYRTLYSIEAIFFKTGMFDPGLESPKVDSSPLFELIKFGKEEGLLDK